MARKIRGRRNEMTERMKHRLCELRAGHYAWQKIIDIFQKEYDYELYYSQLDYYCNKSEKWQAVIDDYRERLNKEVAKRVPIANLIKQIEYLQVAYERAIKWNFVGESVVYVQNPNFDSEKPEMKGNKKLLKMNLPMYKCNPGAAVQAIKVAAEILDGRKIHMQLGTKDGKPIEHRMTHFPPEPKDLADWERQVAEAEKKRKEQEAKSEKEKENKVPLLTH